MCPWPKYGLRFWRRSCKNEPSRIYCDVSLFDWACMRKNSCYCCYCCSLLCCLWSHKNDFESAVRMRINSTFLINVFGTWLCSIYICNKAWILPRNTNINYAQGALYIVTTGITVFLFNFSQIFLYSAPCPKIQDCFLGWTGKAYPWPSWESNNESCPCWNVTFLIWNFHF